MLLATLALTPASPGVAWATAGTDDGATEGPVRHSPHGDLLAPADGATYRLGEPVALQAAASDVDGPLADAAIRWTVTRRTGPAAETVAQLTGPNATFTPDAGHGAGTTYEIRLDVVDEDGLADSSQVAITPQLAKVTLRSTPDGAPLTVDGATGPAPRIVEAAVGQRLQLAATDAFTPAGASEVVLDGWSDGGAAAHEVVVGDGGLELVARYREPRQDIGEAFTDVSASASASAGIAQASSAERRLPALSFDAPDPFGPRTLGGRLREAPAGGHVEIAVRRGSARRAGCSWWVTRNARFTRASKAACAAPRWIRAAMRRTRSGVRWKARLGGELPAGSYAFVVRLLDRDGRPVDFERG